jgi:hypothetical protein
MLCRNVIINVITNHGLIISTLVVCDETKPELCTYYFPELVVEWMATLRQVTQYLSTEGNTSTQKWRHASMAPSDSQTHCPSAEVGENCPRPSPSAHSDRYSYT